MCKGVEKSQLFPIASTKALSLLSATQQVPSQRKAYLAQGSVPEFPSIPVTEVFAFGPDAADALGLTGSSCCACGSLVVRKCCMLYTCQHEIWNHFPLEALFHSVFLSRVA